MMESWLDRTELPILISVSQFHPRRLWIASISASETSGDSPPLSGQRNVRQEVDGTGDHQIERDWNGDLGVARELISHYS